MASAPTEAAAELVGEMDWRAAQGLRTKPERAVKHVSPRCTLYLTNSREEKCVMVEIMLNFQQRATKRAPPMKDFIRQVLAHVKDTHTDAVFLGVPDWAWVPVNFLRSQPICARVVFMCYIPVSLSPHYPAKIQALHYNSLRENSKVQKKDRHSRKRKRDVADRILADIWQDDALASGACWLAYAVAPVALAAFVLLFNTLWSPDQ